MSEYLIIVSKKKKKKEQKNKSKLIFLAVSGYKKSKILLVTYKSTSFT